MQVAPIRSFCDSFTSLAHQPGHWQRGGCPRFGVSGPRLIWGDPGEHSEDEGDGSDADGDDDDDDDDDDNERNLLEVERDTDRVNELVHTFAGALGFERGRRMFGAVATVDSDRRTAFSSDLLANLEVLQQMVRNRFDVNQFSQDRGEFNARHGRIRNTYDLSRNDPNWHTSSVTRLSDLGDEFDVYFVFALESIADMSEIAAVSGRRML